MNNLVLLMFIHFLIEQCATDGRILQQVHIFFRHGKRYPSKRELYPTDPHLTLFKPELLEQLTEIGKYESCVLGNALRSRYGTLIGSTYNPLEIISKSSGTDRTTESAYFVLNGLFSKCEKYGSVSSNYNIISNIYEFQQPRFFCPLYNEELNLFMGQSESQKILEANKQLLEYLTEKTGRSMKSLLDVLFLYGALSAEINLNLAIPQWAQALLPRITNLVITRLQHESGNDILRRLNGGRLLKEVVENMKMNIRGMERERKIFLHACHEFNLFSILTIANAFDQHVPKCSSAIGFELYRESNTENYLVKMLYFKNLFLPPNELPIKNCSPSCYFSEYENIVQPFIPSNYTKECQSSVLLDLN